MKVETLGRMGIHSLEIFYKLMLPALRSKASVSFCMRYSSDFHSRRENKCPFLFNPGTSDWQRRLLENLEAADSVDRVASVALAVS